MPILNVSSFLPIWHSYASAGQERLLNAGKEYTQDELDRARLVIIPEVLASLQPYLAGKLSLDEFKTRVDSINKRNRLWGFKGINGQMFFNMLVKTAAGAGRTSQLEALLRQCLPLPGNLEVAAKAINNLGAFIQDISQNLPDRRAAPKSGSVPYFLSYFWQIQDPQRYPVYYTSMLDVLRDRNLWSPPSDLGLAYGEFYRLNHELIDLFSKEAGRKLTLYDVEHAFWFAAQPEASDSGETVVDKPKSDKTTPLPPPALPDSYFPPIVAILPRLACNDPGIAALCQAQGISIEKVFENRLGILFQMLGYETTTLGQGHGRVPDGIAVCREFHYAIVYDAKVRQNGYLMGADDRAIREYITANTNRLRKDGIRSIYFMIVSSSFAGDHDHAIRSLKMETGASEILLVEVDALLGLLEARLRDPFLTLGPEGIQRLFAASGLLTLSDISEFRGL